MLGSSQQHESEGIGNQTPQKDAVLIERQSDLEACDEGESGVDGVESSGTSAAGVRVDHGVKQMRFKLVEKTEGPWLGRVWRTAEMTREEADTINAKIEVMKWEPCEENTAGLQKDGKRSDRRTKETG